MQKKSEISKIRAKLAEALDTANQTSADNPVPVAMTTIEEATPTVASEAPVAATPVVLTANQIVNGSMLLAAGAGAVPAPLWDSALVFGVQIKMLADLSAAYGKPFTENLGRSAVAALLAGAAPALIARGALGSLVKSLPGIGSVLGAVTQPALAAALTYGVGKVFIKHYESGGTLLSFNATEFKNNFTTEVKAGMKKACEFKY